ECRYYNFMGYNQAASALTGLTPNGQLPYTINSSYSTVSVGLDFKFGGPVVAQILRMVHTGAAPHAVRARLAGGSTNQTTKMLTRRRKRRATTLTKPQAT